MENHNGIVASDQYEKLKSYPTLPAIGQSDSAVFLAGNGSFLKPAGSAVDVASQNSNGLMSAADKQKLNGIAAGAQVNSVTGVKGNAETSYRTGNVNITAANVGAAASSHTHNYAGSASAGGSANSAVKLDGFTQSTSQTWGQQAGTFINGMSDGAGGAMAWRKNCPSSGKTSYILDGLFYQNEGTYPCLDTSYLPLSIARGGTGATVASTARQNLFPTNMESSANYFITINDGWQTGGYVTLAKARNRMGLGDTTGALPVANGGTGATTAANARTNIGAAASDHNHDSTYAAKSHNHYSIMVGTCTTASSTAAKTVTIEGVTVTAGVVICVIFQHQNSIQTPTLNVNNSGAYPILEPTGEQQTFYFTKAQNQAVFFYLTSDLKWRITVAGGFMSADDKKKLNGIAAGAQVNTVTGIKGNAETSYRTGSVNLTPANIGAAASSHAHAAGDITSGTLAVARGGTGQTALSSVTVGKADQLSTARTINGISFDGSANLTLWGTCDTAAKVGTLTGYTLNDQTIFWLRFKNANTASNPTLNINGTGAYPIFYGTNAVSGYRKIKFCSYAGEIVCFKFTSSTVTNGTGYKVIGPLPDS